METQTARQMSFWGRFLAILVSFLKHFEVKVGEKAVPERDCFFSEKMATRKTQKNRAQEGTPIIDTLNFPPLGSAGG